MATLKEAGLVTDRRDAQWVRYRRNLNLRSERVAIVDAVMATTSMAVSQMEEVPMEEVA
jgi:ArsR family transcriptional regulator